jgi:hypothetical protein
LVELWESVNGGAFTSVAQASFAGADLSFTRTGTTPGLNRYFFKILPSSANLCDRVNNSDTATVSILQLALPMLATNDKTLVITNPEPNTSYRWQEKENNSSWQDIVPFVTTISFAPDKSSVYRVKAENGVCVVFSQEQSFHINSSSTSPEVYYGPNPTTGILHIDSLKLSDQWQTLEILNGDGTQRLATYAIQNQTSVTLNVESLRPGLYFGVLRRSNGNPVSFKFIKM